MIFRSCAGGVVFSENKVFLLQNEKYEWVFPKGVIREGMLSKDVALHRVEAEAGIANAKIVVPIGETSYEFYSITRQKPVCNEITWYIMQATGEAYAVNSELGFRDGGYFALEDAIERITYSQDNALLT